MNPHMVLALLAKFTSLSREAAEKIAKEIDLTTQPSTYKDAEALVEQIVSAIRK